MSGIPEQIGKAIGQLDIDFSRLTLAGWFVSLLSLLLGFVTSFGAYLVIRGQIADARAPGLAFGLTMIAVTVASFLAMRFILVRLGIRLTKVDA